MAQTTERDYGNTNTDSPRHRISCLSEEYLSKYRQVRRIIKQYTGQYPSAELTLEAMIDEFLNLHIGTDWEREEL